MVLFDFTDTVTIAKQIGTRSDDSLSRGKSRKDHNRTARERPWAHHYLPNKSLASPVLNAVNEISVTDRIVDQSIRINFNVAKIGISWGLDRCNHA